MGFNKRYINEQKIRDIIKENGIHYLINLIKRSDTLIMEDKFSVEVCEFIKENEEEYIIKKLVKKF